jgi:hypothetical protein
MASQPGRDWAGRDLAALPGIKPRNMLTQPAEWTRLGFLAKTGPGRYALFAAVGYIRAAASRASVPVRQARQDLAGRPGHPAP